MIRTNRFSQILLTAVFIMLLAAPIAVIRWTGGEHSMVEKRVLAPRPAVFLADGRFNRGAGGEWRRWLEDHIGFREQFVRLCAEIKLKFFGYSPSPLVHLGKDGWYFYTLDENLKIATGDYTLTQETLERTLASHLAIRDKLAEKGIEYIVVFPPSKVSIYPEYLRYGDGKVRATPVDIVADYLEAHSNLKIVRFKERLLEAKKERQVFFKTDTHWNHAGAYAAYREVITRMNEWGLCEKPPVDVTFEPAEYIGEFGNMMGVTLSPEPTLNTRIAHPAAVVDKQSERHRLFLELLKSEEILTPSRHYVNRQVKGPSVMLFHDSMFARWNIPESFAENFSEAFFVWTGADIHESLLDAMKPDIVINESTERYLNTFPAKNQAFLKK